jgi:hypothetical protein
MNAMLGTRWRADWLQCLGALCVVACEGEVRLLTPEVGDVPEAAAPLDTDMDPEPAADASPCGAAACVSEPVPLRPSEACAGAPALKPSSDHDRTLLTLSGSNALGADTSQSPLGGCNGATLGPDVWHLLDLSGMSGPVEVVAVLDSNFDAALDLREGPCGDTLSRDCDRGSALGRPSSSLRAQLEPAAYWLVVDGHQPESRGEFQLQIEVDARRGSCSQPFVPTSCEQPVRLNVEARATLLLDMSCTTEGEEERTFHFDLDLSAEAAPVAASIHSWSPTGRRFGRIGVYRADAPATDCGTPLAESYDVTGVSPNSNTQLTSLLAPGRYVIEVDVDTLDLAGAASPAALSVALDRERCRSGPHANTCDTAIELATSMGARVIEGDTTCNSNHLTLSDCAESEAPEQFYRLDLSTRAGPTQVRMGIRNEGLEFSPLLYLLTSGAENACGEALHCYNSMANFEGPPVYELMLPPAVYFIGVDAEVPRSAGRYQLFVELSPGSPRSCVDAEMLACQWLNAFVVCCNEPENIGCARSLELCGLASETTACVCDANPACCGADGSRESCPDLFEECGYLCPDFAQSEDQCLVSYR